MLSNSISLEFHDKISMLAVTLGSDLSWNGHIISVAKAAACKLGFLFRTKRFFTPTQLLTLDKARIRPCHEYCSHWWRGASKHSLNTLDAIQRRAIRLIGDPAATDTLDSRAHRRSASALSLFYHSAQRAPAKFERSKLYLHEPLRATFDPPAAQNLFEIQGWNYRHVIRSSILKRLPNFNNIALIDS